MLVIVEGATRALYTSVAIEVLVKVVPPAPVGLVVPPTGARALVVHVVTCQQSMADILWNV